MKNTAVIIICLICITANSQELEPRFLSSMPVKTNIAALVYGYSTGNILLDNALPIEDLNSNLHTAAFIYVRSFKLFNRLAKIDATIPYSTAKFNAVLDAQDASTSRNGFGDPSFRLSMIFIGEDPLTPQEFVQREKSKFKFGAAFKIRAPLGEYDNDKFINLGTNRWGFQIKTAAAYRVSKRVILEGHISSWFFTKNKTFFPDKSVTQEPLISSQLNIAYIFSPKIWASIAFGAVANGKTAIDGIKKDNAQKNSRFGAVFSYKTSKKTNLKFIFTNGLSTNVGTDFNSYLIGYSWLCFSK